MWDIISMWKNPKMIAFTALTALLYTALIYPFTQFNFFGGNADFLRVGTAIPAAFSFLFGPAAAWGTAIGNVIYDAATTGLRPISVFGFFANFLLAYLPYKLWSRITAQTPDLRSLKKAGLFVGLTAVACGVCGLIIGWGLYWLGIAPFDHAAPVIAWSDALWAVTLGAVLLASTYGAVSRRKLLYPDLLNTRQTPPSMNRTRIAALTVLAISMVLAFVIGSMFSAIDVFILLPFVAVSVIAAVVACR
jgi:energy-coupling factor transport system substrate-specific component